MYLTLSTQTLWQAESTRVNTPKSCTRFHFIIKAYRQKPQPKVRIMKMKDVCAKSKGSPNFCFHLDLLCLLVCQPFTCPSHRLTFIVQGTKIQLKIVDSSPSGVYVTHSQIRTHSYACIAAIIFISALACVHTIVISLLLCAEQVTATIRLCHRRAPACQFQSATTLSIVVETATRSGSFTVLLYCPLCWYRCVFVIRIRAHRPTGWQ